MTEQEPTNVSPTWDPPAPVLEAAKPGTCAGCGGAIAVGQGITPAPYRRWSHATETCVKETVARYMPTPRRTAPAYAIACPTCSVEPDDYCVTSGGKTRSLHPERIALAAVEAGG